MDETEVSKGLNLILEWNLKKAQNLGKNSNSFQTPIRT